MVQAVASIPHCAWRRFVQIGAGDEGQDLTEYALLLMLIVIVVVGAVTLLGGTVHNTLYEPVLAAWPS